MASTEIFDPITKTFSSGDNMKAARASHTATVFPDGKILIAGGYDS